MPKESGFAEAIRLAVDKLRGVDLNVRCPHCGTEIEFWKDEPVHHCPKCKKPVRNPKIDTGCTEWCKYAGECLGEIPDSE